MYPREVDIGSHLIKITLMDNYQYQTEFSFTITILDIEEPTTFDTEKVEETAQKGQETLIESLSSSIEASFE